MPNNLDEFQTVFGTAIKLSRPDADDKTNFTVKSLITGKYVNATLWDNQHAHVELKQGDIVIVNGPIKKTPKKDSDDFWINLNVKRITVLEMDEGVRDDAPVKESAADLADEPDVL